MTSTPPSDRVGGERGHEKGAKREKDDGGAGRHVEREGRCQA